MLEGRKHAAYGGGEHGGLALLEGADLAYGWVNRALPADELDDFVDRLARNIAALPEGVIASAKQAIAPDAISAGLVREHDAWATQIGTPAAGQLIQDGLERGAQTRDGERHLERLLRGLA